jgi:hypothetical protein
VPDVSTAGIGVARVPAGSGVRAQRWDELPTLLSDAVLDELLIWGRYDELPGMLKARFDAIADGVVLPYLMDDDGPLASCVAELKA